MIMSLYSDYGSALMNFIGNTGLIHPSSLYMLGLLLLHSLLPLHYDSASIWKTPQVT